MGQIIISPEGPQWFRSSVGLSSIPKIVSVQGDCFPASCIGIHHPSPKETWDMPTVCGGQGTLGGRPANWLWLTMPTKGALKLSSKGDCNLQRSKQKVNQLVHTTEANSHSSHPLSRALLLTCLFPLFFFPLPFTLLQKTVNKGISSICSHSFKYLHQLSIFL